MAANSFGTLFRITTWGESHGKGIGVVIDGCPAGLNLSEDDINKALSLRAPGKNKYTTTRKEPDVGEIYSGIFEGITTGAPISIIIHNQDADPSKYDPIKDLMRPGHANYTYLEKYGQFDYRGGGRASARETACRVAAGAVAQKILGHYGIELTAYLSQVGSIVASIDLGLEVETLRKRVYGDPVFCSDELTSLDMRAAITRVTKEGDSLGGVVGFLASGLPAGLGDPVYEKIEAKVASAMLSIPASKGFEIGVGFEAVSMFGSTHNDAFQEGEPSIRTNHAGGMLGGISTGLPIFGRVAFKPTSSIRKRQDTIDTSGKHAEFILPKGSRHDPCVAIRAVPVVEAMLALVLVDCFLMNKSSKL
ncbi:MAG: chorismate synthase [Sphingomonadales bacterium]